MTILDSRPETSPIGARVPNVDWDSKTAGDARYSGDVNLPGMLFARILRSPHPHAEIRSIDVSDALRDPAVACVVTAADLPDRTYIHHGGPLSDRRPLARGVVRFVGEEIAGVAAESLADADAALRRIRTVYSPLPAVTTVSEALRPKAPAVHPGGNLSVRSQRHWGEPREDRKPVASVSGSFKFGRQTHATMETHSIVARWNAEVRLLELWTSTQAPFIVRKEIAHVLDLDLDSVVVHEISVGGGFGAKSKICEYEAIACALSMKSGRPVKLVLTREEDFTATKSRHAFEVDLTTSVTAEGLLCERDVTLRVDNGAYNHSGPSVMANGTQVIGSLYRIPEVRIDANLVYTNKQPGGQFRGYGAPQVVFALESQMDELADQLGIDPIDIRIRNANQAGDVTLTGWCIDSARLVECLERARDEIGWVEKKSLRGSGRGVGFAAAIHVSGANIYDGANRSSAGIDVGADGRILLRFGGSDAGTWQKTLLAQFAAQELKVQVSDISVLTMESHQTPHELGAWSSRGTFMSGHSVGAVARTVARKLLTSGAEILGVDPSTASLVGGCVVSGDASIDFSRIVRECFNGLLTVTEEVELPIDQVNRETGVANISGAYSFAVQAVEVEVDRDTGKVTILDAVSVHDSGIAINPIGAESQIIGGMAMGLGFALGEELLVEGGKSMTRSYIQYPLPRAEDLPPIRAIMVEEPDPHGPHGAKGLGEIVLVPTGAAVANAIAHATGARIRELPATPDRVLKAMNPARKRKAHLWRRPNRWWIEAMRRAYPLGAHALLHRWGTKWAKVLPHREIESIVRPDDAMDASRALKQQHAQVIAGGTDLMPARRQGVSQPSTLVDISVVPGLERIHMDDSRARFGATARLADLSRAAIGTPFSVLHDVIEQIANPQIREMATVGGNLCQQNRCWFLRNDFLCYKRGGVTCPCYAVQGDHRFYHSIIDGHRCQSVTPSDLGTVLAMLDATVEIQGPHGMRHVNAADLYKGPGETVLKEGEIITSIEASAPDGGVAYEKLNRSGGDFAILSAACRVSVDGQGKVSDARVILGAVAPTPWRAREVEDLLIGRPFNDVVGEASSAWEHHSHPLPDNEWKIDAMTGVLRRTLSLAHSRAIGGKS